MNTIVTGGCGFIGSHLVDELVKSREVKVIDNMSSGKYMNNKAETLKIDILDKEELNKAVKGAEEIYHLAANPDVKLGADDTKIHLEQNIIATHNVLEAMRKNDIKKIYFASTSTVYGRADKIPTPEDYGPLMPVSLYGASKLACEGIITSYCATFGMQASIFRFANIIGGRSRHGVTLDFINKLKANSKQLEILGNGKQCKSYLHVSDCIDAVLHCTKNRKNNIDIYNIGSEDKITVNEIANIVSKAMNLKPKYNYTGGEIGWKGDLPIMLLSVDKIKKIGWTPKLSSEQSVEKTVNEILRLHS